MTAHNFHLFFFLESWLFNGDGWRVILSFPGHLRFLHSNSMMNNINEHLLKSGTQLCEWLCHQFYIKDETLIDVPATLLSQLWKQHWIEFNFQLTMTELLTGLSCQYLSDSPPKVKRRLSFRFDRITTEKIEVFSSFRSWKGSFNTVAEVSLSK